MLDKRVRKPGALFCGTGVPIKDLTYCKMDHGNFSMLIGFGSRARFCTQLAQTSADDSSGKLVTRVRFARSN